MYVHNILHISNNIELLLLSYRKNRNQNNSVCLLKALRQNLRSPIALLGFYLTAGKLNETV